MHRESELAAASGPLPWLASLDAFAGPVDAAPLRDMARAFAAEAGTSLGHAHGTLRRFQWLAAITGCDVVVGKLFEPHLDALSILEELHGPTGDLAGRLGLPAEPVWAVWAAEGPGQLGARQAPDGTWRLQGRKSWCSGAARVDAALVGARDPAGEPRLFAVSLKSGGIGITRDGWSAVGMAQTDSVDVLFDGVPAEAVGGAGSYVGRIGFWHGAAGIAACWHGAAVAIAQPLRERAMRGAAPADPFLLMALGAVDAALASSALALREAAASVDLHCSGGPAFGQREALRVRAVVEAAAQEVIERTGRALGAGPLCRDAAHARRVADLTVFLRQSHAEQDLAALGARVAQEGDKPWML
ncbi:acyl-CoA dehydrogenase [Sphingomonas sp. NCPPB 2930]